MPRVRLEKKKKGQRRKQINNCSAPNLIIQKGNWIARPPVCGQLRTKLTKFEFKNTSTIQQVNMKMVP